MEDGTGYSNQAHIKLLFNSSRSVANTMKQL